MKRYLVRVQLALVYWVEVLDDFNLVLSEALAVETLRESRAEPHEQFITEDTQRRNSIIASQEGNGAHVMVFTSSL